MPFGRRQALDSIETSIQALMQRVGRHLTEALLEPSRSAPMVICRECGSPLRQVDSRRPRAILGIFGPYACARPYLVCPQGHGSAAPQDRVLKLGPGRVSPKLAAILARIAIDVPFDPVPDILAESLGLEVDGEMVRRVTEDLGSWAEAQEQQTIQDAQSEQAAVPAVPGPSTLLIAMDGALVHTTRARDGHRGVMANSFCLWFG